MMYKFITIGFIIGGLCTILGALYLAYDTQSKVENWIQVRGQVVDLEVRESYESNRPGGSTWVYHVELTYRYKFGDETYENTISVSEGKKKDVAQYAIGGSRLLSVNPSNPNQISHAVGYNFETFVGSIISFGLGLVFLVLGILLWKPPKLKVNMNFLIKFIPVTFILIGIGFVVGAWFIYVNDPESLDGPIFLGILGLLFIVIATINLINQARDTGTAH